MIVIKHNLEASHLGELSNSWPICSLLVRRGFNSGLQMSWAGCFSSERLLLFPFEMHFLLSVKG